MRVYGENRREDTESGWLLTLDFLRNEPGFESSVNDLRTEYAHI